MIDRTVDMLVQVLTRKSDCSQEQREVYQYGVYAVVSTALVTLMVEVVSGLISDFLAGAVYILFFTVIRMFCGGYHARSFAACFLTSLVCVAGVNIVAVVTPAASFPVFTTAVMACSCAVILLLSPVVSAQHPVSARQLRRNRRLSRCIVFVETLVVLCGIQLFKTSLYLYVASLTTGVVAILLVFSKVQTLWEVKYNEQAVQKSLKRG